MENVQELAFLIECEAKNQGVWNLLLDQANFLLTLNDELTIEEAIVQASVHIIE